MPTYTKLAWLTKEELEDLYLVKHLTLQEIADKFGVTRAGVLKAINRNGIDTATAARFNITCRLCKTSFETTRKRWHSSLSNYCSQECYRVHRRKASSYKPSRQGQRNARKVMAEHIGRELYPEEVVHHEDGDCKNNHVDNLILFISQAEHLRYHHQRRQEPLF